MAAYGKAKVIDGITLEELTTFVMQKQTRHRDRAILMLSHAAGLRAAEISGLLWSDLMDAKGTLCKDVLVIPSRLAKKGHERQIPMHPKLYDALKEASVWQNSKWIAYMETDPSRNMSANWVAQWFKRLYAEFNLQGCSSHSGRRSLITKLARNANKVDCSLVDVQHIAGHKYIDTTQRYVEPSSRVGDLMKLSV